jgi:hypothetical protein
MCSLLSFGKGASPLVGAGAVAAFICLNCDFRMIEMIFMIERNHLNQINHIKITVQTVAVPLHPCSHRAFIP